MIYERGYFMDSQVSNYQDYTKKKYGDLCKDLIQEFNMQVTDILCDFGCATGQLLYEFKARGFKELNGTDPSYWAIEYGINQLGLAQELQHYNKHMLVWPKDYLLLLDVLEHVPTLEEIKQILEMSCEYVKKSVILRVPVSIQEGNDFYLEVSRNDKTHVQCHTKEWWTAVFKECGYELEREIRQKNIYSSKGVFAAAFKHK
jgi:hypothetical protein